MLQRGSSPSSEQTILGSLTGCPLYLKISPAQLRQEECTQHESASKITKKESGLLTTAYFRYYQAHPLSRKNYRTHIVDSVQLRNVIVFSFKYFLYYHLSLAGCIFYIKIFAHDRQRFETSDKPACATTMASTHPKLVVA